MIFSVRLLYLFFLVIFFLIIQFINDPFVDVRYSINAFAIVTFSLLLNGAGFFLPDSQKKRFNTVLCFYEVLFISTLIYITDFSQSAFLLLYLVNICLIGTEKSKGQTILITLFTSLCFNLLVAFTESLQGQTLNISIIVNNVAFLGTAIGSLYLRQYFYFLRDQVQSQRTDLKNLKALNQLIVSNVANAMLATDLDGQITFTNQAAQKLFKIHQRKQKNLKELFFSSYSKVEGLMTSSNQKSFSRAEISFETSISLEVIVSKLKSSSGVPKGFLFMIQDLTEIKELEKKLRQKEKLAAVGQLAAGIAHEIRNPLASISGSLQIMSEEDRRMSPEELKLMRIALREIDRLNLLISEFMDYVKPESYENQDVDLNAILEEVLEMAKVNSKLRTETEQVIDLKSRSEISGNPSKLKQAFLNLIINSYQAMESVEAPKIEVYTYEQDGYVRVTIADKGVGISEENLSRIFEPFHTTKSKGTGLGLAVTYKIFEAHQAQVDVESTVGEGTRFTITFPKGQGPLGEEQKQSHVA